MAKSSGKLFEEDFIKSIPKNIFKYRLRDSAGTWQGGENTRFTPSNICDFILHNGSRLYLLELKSHKGKSVPINCIRDNQLKGLINASNHENVISGLIFNFRELESTYFVTITDFVEFMSRTSKKSINEKDCQSIGTLIPQQKKISRFNYDISAIFEK